LKDRLLCLIAGALLSATSLWIAPAHSQEDFRCPAPGTVIEFSNGVKITATSGDGFWCSFTDQRGRPFRRFAIFALENSSWIDKGLESLWPLKVGNQRTFETIAAAGRVATGIAESWLPVYYTSEFRVTGRETVTVPAGTFETFVVQWREFSHGPQYDGTRTWWIAPKIGYFVKSTYTQAAGLPGRAVAWEAVRISIPEAELTPKRF